MNSLIAVLLLISQCFIDNGIAKHEKYIRTIHGYQDEPPVKQSFIINADESVINENRHKRAVSTPNPDKDNKTSTINQKINFLNDTHKQLMVHWVGEGSNVIICLARDPSPTIELYPPGPSSVYISYDYGNTYENKTALFKLPNGTQAILDKFYNHPKYNTHFVFTDVRSNKLYVTSNHGRNITRYDLNFSPSEITFHEFLPSTIVALDKKDPSRRLWVSEDYGKTFRNVHEMVNQFNWVKDSAENQFLMMQRLEPNNLSSVLYTSLHTGSVFAERISTMYSTHVVDLFVKNDYIFTTKRTSRGTLELYVSFKLGRQIKCVFDTTLDPISYYIVDVTSNRALVAISHNSTTAHLYVSENLDTVANTVRFTLSLENVMCYFPNSTWHDTWIHHLAEEAFADVYKVEGLTGIYIASRVLQKPSGNFLGPQHLGSVITFDHGRSWRLLQAPERDYEGQPNACQVANNCSLHLSQKFNHLYPDTRSISILSSKSAPGLIIATGILGKSLKGHYGVYISSDAGLTWRQTLRDLYFFNMGDHGAILTAVAYYKSKSETRHVSYSTDEGETWQEEPFYNEDVRLYGLMTEPGENTTVFTMFGSLTQEHRWIIIKLDLIKAFKYNCTKDDYKMWSPSQITSTRSYIPCVLGQQQTFERRMAHSNCYNGLDYDAPVSIRPCGCDIYDYECDFGFVRSEKPGHCIRNPKITLDMYKVPNTCTPGKFYRRTKGYRKIQGDVCVNGFKNDYEPEEIPCPIKEMDDFLLFAQRERISRFNLITRTMEELPVKKLKNVIAIDFDIKNNCVYWADIALDTIGRQCFNSNSSEAEILVSSDLASIEGMALDWISNHLYFVDGMRSKIEMIRTDIQHSGRMRRTILSSDVLKKPRGIALHPRAGYMFWTDWSTENPSVNRANLDGSNIRQLFTRPRVEWPNGITIDYIAERIYWVDARKDYIASSDLHGDYFKLIVTQDDVVSHPFAVAVFKSNMYWDDWKRNSIFSADKDYYRGVEVLQKQLPGLMDLKVYAHGIQVGANACSANRTAPCDFICVGGPVGQKSCLCPDGFEQRNGKCVCPGGGGEPYANATCPKVGNTCNVNHFACGNGLCVPKVWKCDGEDDCGDNSDEMHCGYQACPQSYFVCGDGKCLPQYWRCDYDNDCTDGSDELNCPKPNCTDGKFTCNNGRCISAKWKCDGENDCRDNSDEMNCGNREPSTCKNNEFQCKTGAVTCIPPTWRCDGEKDCRDGSDEFDCANNTCLQGQFACGPPQNRCIYATWVCDGDRDCLDGLDEENCTKIHNVQQPAITQFIPKNGTCQDWMFLCSNQKCVPFWWKCDGTNDCGDGSDEIGCTNLNPKRNMTGLTTTTPTPSTPPQECGKNEFQCSPGACIFSAFVCDGFEDCPNAEDEKDCANLKVCDVNHFKCRTDGSCIALKKVCDGKSDCPDGTDEQECEHHIPEGPATPSCSVGYFPCDGSCHPLDWLCNGNVDCTDGYDESNCTKTSRVYQVLEMGIDQRNANATTLLLFWWMPSPNKVKLEFMPSICKVGEKQWENRTWTDLAAYRFDNLQPFTAYNMTVYVRVQNNSSASQIFPPAKYFVAQTNEGVPSEAWNVTVKQKNGSHVLVTWNQPAHPNGIVTNYQINWYSESEKTIKLKLNGNETAHLLAADFQEGKTYTFYVTVFNRKYESKPSEEVSLMFHTQDLLAVQHLALANTNESSLTITWQYPLAYDAFEVDVMHEEQDRYPPFAVRKVNATEITLSELSPGVYYIIAVRAVKKDLYGPVTRVSAKTLGTPLPEVASITANLIGGRGTSVNVTWETPKDARKVNWEYGVYYGIDAMELKEKPRFRTSNLSAIIHDLNSCEYYTFNVALVGPFGFGPLSRNVLAVQTSYNQSAPPKNLNVSQEGDNPLRMRVTWQSSCSISQNISYIIRIYERVRGLSWTTKVENIRSEVFNISYGAIYDVSVSTDDPHARFTENVTYQAHPIMPPYELRVFLENNGSFIVTWQERELPQHVGEFKYEVLVSEGNTLNETTAERIITKDTSLIYTNNSAQMYTFAVRILADTGYTSAMSTRVSLASEAPETPISSTSLSLILGLTAVALIAVAALTVFVVKHRRLQNSFSRFANSHYDSRSGAATFDDHSGLEDEDSPQITGFSDDEPLVIA